MFFQLFKKKLKWWNILQINIYETILSKSKIKKNNSIEYQLYSTPYFDTRSLIRRYSCLQSLSHYNLGQNIVDKLKKESKIGFSMKYFTADFLQLPITVAKGKL